MQPHPYAPYPYANGAPVPVRYMVPPGYRQNSPPYANQQFDRYPAMPPGMRPPQNMAQPLRYPPGYGPGYGQPGMPMTSAPTSSPVGVSPRPQLQRNPSEQLQPPQPYYYNPYGANGENPGVSSGPKTPGPKKGAKEYKDNAFTIAPDGANSETIKGLVSNNNINDLLKHKGTKVKVSKIYRITKSKPEIKEESSDEEIPIMETPKSQPVPQPTQRSAQQPTQRSAQQRPISSSSSGSHCSTCSNCSCSECRHRQRSHVDDDCPDCRAERNREQSRRDRRK